MKLSYAALSDVGRVRKDNQDSGYAGPHLLVVADGVGGSARGDVASSHTVEVLRRLDEPPDGDPLGRLTSTIAACHDRIARLVAAQPELDGTSTTVTALLFDGASVSVAHVGDSRGYLLREGTLSQLTTDHTFVQSLIDEGRITEDEARVHPHRNLILRAVDGVHEPEPDVFTVEVAEGDRILLCSDGASGVLAQAELARLLADGTPDAVAVALVSAALDAGSSDNVTVVVADVVPDDHVADADTSAALSTGPMLVGAAAEGARGMLPGVPVSADTGELPRLSEESPPSKGSRGRGRKQERHREGDATGGDVDPEEARYAPQPPRRLLWLRRTAVLLVLALAIALIGMAAYRWSQDRYFVGVSGSSVVIYRGVDVEIPGVGLNEVFEETDLMVEDLPDAFARRVQQGVAADTLEDARNVVADYSGQVDCPDPQPEPTPTPTPPRNTLRPDGRPPANAPSSQDASASPGASPEASPSATPSPSATRTPAVCAERP